MSRILLIQQYLGKNEETGPIFPLGLSYIATAIKKTGWDINILDMNLYTDAWQILHQTIQEFKPDVTGISLRNIDNVDYYNFNYFYGELKTLTGEIKKYNCPLIIGGAGFSIFSRQIMERNNDIDFGIFLEGEITITELLKCIESKGNPEFIKGLLYRQDGQIVFTGKREQIDFANSNMPDRSLFEIDKYTHPLSMGVQAKRGCILKCSYCTYPYLEGGSLRIRNPKDIVDEIKYLMNNHNVQEIIFTDDIFNIPYQHAIDIINELLDCNIKIKWSAWFDVSTTDKYLLDLAKKSGCYRVCFSVDGVIDETLKALQKNFTEPSIKELLRLCSSHIYSDIDFRFSLFASPPGQTVKGLLKTIIFVFKTHLLMKNSKCLVSHIRLLPNTDIMSKIETDKNDFSFDLLPNNVNSKKDNLFFSNSQFKGIHNKIYFTILYFINEIRLARKNRKINLTCLD